MAQGPAAPEAPAASSSPSPEPIEMAPAPRAERAATLETVPEVDRCLEPGAWVWQQPRPHGNTLRAAWGASDDDVWAVGDAGTIEHWDGRAWSRVVAHTTETLTTIWGSSAADVWAAGGTTILRFDGSRWSVVPSPNPHPLFDVWGSRPDDVWAGGDGGTLVHWDGRAWTKVSPGTDRGLLHFRGAGPRNLSVLLDDGQVMEWNGSAGKISPPLRLPGDRRYSVSIERMGGERWVFATNGLVSVLANGSWRDGPPVPVALPYRVVATAIDGTTPVALSSSGRLFKLDGANWNETVTMTTALKPEQGPVALFRSWAFGPLGAIWRREGSTWKELRPRTDRIDRTGVWASSPSDVWIARADGAVDRFDGKTWIRLRTPLARANGIRGFGRTDVWVVGEGGAAHFDGARFTRHALGTEPLVAIAAKGPRDVWTIAHNAGFHWNGKSWSRSAAPKETALYDVALDSAGAAWVRGRDTIWNEHEQVYAWSGRTFIARTIEVSPWPAWPWSFQYGDQLRALGHAESGDLFALTATPTGNTIHRRVDGSWQSENIPVESFYYKRAVALHAFASGEAWVVGAGGVVVHRCASADR